jgi:hypothetical protein
MKRNPSTRSNKPSARPRIVDSRRLAEARGGGDLGIAVTGGTVTADYMSQQHNEALIRLWPSPEPRRPS